MKLYYDMLVPYMPDSVKDADGNLVKSDKRASGRDAMIDLSNFQQSGDVNSLYHSVLSACIYADKDLVDVIVNIPEDVEVPNGTSIDKVLDNSAKMLFSSIKDMNNFDINVYVCNLLTAAHAILVNRSVENAKSDDKES